MLIQGTFGNEILNGTSENDTIDGDSGNDTLLGFQGNDQLIGGEGNDEFFGGEGNDLFVLEYFDNLGSTNNLDVVADFVQGEDRIDVSHLGITDFNTMLAISEDDEDGNVVFSLQYDQFDGNFYRLKINGLSKNQLQASDFHFGNNNQNQNLQGTLYNDDLFGSLGDDTLVASPSPELLSGDEDRLFGDQGDDVLFGKTGSDSLYGGADNDLLVGDYDSDIFFGGTGSDIFALEYFKDADTRFIFYASEVGLTWDSLEELLMLIELTGFDSINQLDVVKDFVQGQDKIDVSLMGISDFNTILAIAEDDENGNVVFKSQYFHKANDDFYALRIDGISKNQLQASDFIFSTNNVNDNFENINNIFRDDLFGGLGNDTLRGGSDDDRLFGEQGNDVLDGGSGVNQLYGGLGEDVAVLSNNFDQYTVSLEGNAIRLENDANNEINPLSVEDVTNINYLYDIEQIQFADQMISADEIINMGVSLDIDGNGILELQDYNLIDLYAAQLDEFEFEFLLNDSFNDLIGENASRTDAESILTYLNQVGDSLFDIDGNGVVELQDYNLIDLYAGGLDEAEFDLLLENYPNDLIGVGASRTLAASILAYFETIVPESI